MKESGPDSMGYTLGSRVGMVLPAYIKDPLDSMVAARSTTDGDEGDKDKDNEKKEIKDVEGNAVEEGEGDQEVEVSMELDKSLKWFVPPPAKKRGENISGSSSSSASSQSLAITDSGIDVIRNEVTDIVTNMVFSVARSLRSSPYPTRPKLPDPFQPKSEIEVIIAKGEKPLFMHLGKYRDHPVVLGFKPLPSGGKGPAEETGRLDYFVYICVDIYIYICISVNIYIYVYCIYENT
jgi:hypothetical protein